RISKTAASFTSKLR
ncbi:imcF-related N-terminal domain protein, partial [Vibrio parahaemolyticus V-223/04]